MTNVWSDVTEQPIPVIKSGTWANVIADSSRRLQQCVQEQLTHIDNRARALATSGNFEAALNDVAMIRQLAPSSSVGYLCAGHVYSLQGRQKAAIDIYDQGLAAVPLSDPSHQRLVEARSMAQERDSTRIDFIKEFPIDIIENIAPRILAEEIAPSEIRRYLGVSRIWRERLLMCIRELHIESTHKDELAHDDDLLEQVAHHCTTLTLHSNTTGFPRLMSKTQLPSLQTLIAYDPRGADDDDDDDFNPGIAALVSVGSTLTHLEIKTSAYGVRLGEILRSCPNLVHLEAWNVDTDMVNGPECHPTLKRLLFWVDHDESDIHDIAKRLPGLELFATSRFHDTKDLKILHDNCPSLKVVGCNDDGLSFGYAPKTTTTTTTAQSHDDQQDCFGVRIFFIECNYRGIYSMDLKDIMDFMRRNSHTLQQVWFHDIDLVGGDTPILNRAIQVADDVFKSLTTFTCRIYGQVDILFTRWIARESPHLKELKLMRDCDRSQDPTDSSALFDDLIGRCELESVIFELYGDPTTDMGSVERFIQYHSTFDSQLHTLTLPKHTRLSKDALHALSKLPQLEKLSISWPFLMKEEEDQGDEKCSHFVDKLNRLKHLGIWSDEVVPDDVFVHQSFY
ncbi:hypothetical protein O0I10_009610 [Lichtheimia ornata]|uniref:F-box domain-containing protein n=1 Tax=Lichtheimia ornata TaxID=688661 RepID=A0AAD7UXJ8_9FUNG|nr:uncharacterized protein O0I10_009610 [Lichtheimia ornata]KAJ8654719.1 hypothetical protein O0I10_009610 [Lichtheimia ornata]